MAKRRTYEFLQLTSTISYPPAQKAQLSVVHSKLIEQVIQSFNGTRKMKEHVIHVFNCISYMYTNGDSLPSSWNEDDPLHTYVDYADDVLESNLSCYLHLKDVDWVDVKSVVATIAPTDSVVTLATKEASMKSVPTSDPVVIPAPIIQQIQHTDKSDLYIQPPKVPRFDTSQPVAAGNIDGVPFAVYKSYPEIPTKQNEISATTDVNRMTEADLMKLFPTEFIRTRSECMYQSCGGLHMDEKLGLILPIYGYTDAQLLDNIVRYPHIFKLHKEVNGALESFYSTIEIDGELYKTSDVWKTLPEASLIPYTKEFVKEYVVRRYLLERDIKKVKHRYSLYGTLDPFLTLFTTADDYIRMGYHDPVALAHDCVVARVNYKQSRNPVLRRLSNV